MGLLDVHAEGIEAGIQRQLRNPGPPPPERDFSTLSFFGAAGRGIPTAGLETMGTVADLITKDTSRNAPGTVLRRKANEFAPPEAAHTADKVIHGLTRFGTKVAVDVGTMGPVAGAVALAIDEGNTTTQNLRVQGVDTATAAKVGAVTGVVSGVGAVLPIAGSTVKATVGLIAAGGPASYVAQEAAAREILQRAGYGEEAAKHDPTDPLGLALSVAIPGFVGGIHIRNLRKVAVLDKIKAEADMRKAADLTPAEQANSAAYERSAANLRELEQAIAKEKRPEVRKDLEAELAKQREAAARDGQQAPPLAADEAMAAASRTPEAQDAARVRVTADALARSLPDNPAAHGEVMRAADMVAAGDSVDVLPMIAPAERDANLRAFMADSKVVDEQGAPLMVYHGTARDFDAFDNAKAGSAIDAGKLGEGAYFTQDPRWAGSYAANAAKAGGDPLTIPAYIALKNPLVLDAGDGYLKQVQQVSKEWGIAAKPSIDESQTPNPVWAKEFAAEARRRGFDGVSLPGVKGQTEFVVFNPEQIKSAIGNSGRFDPTSTSLTDPLPRPESAVPRGRNDLPPPDTVTAMDAAPVARTEADAPAVPAATLARLTKEMPDMPVRLPGSDKTTTLAQALEMAKKEAEFEAGEADLVKAAFECALGYGA